MHQKSGTHIVTLPCMSLSTSRHTGLTLLPHRPGCQALIGVIVERTTAAQQNMSSLQEEELKKGQIVP